MYLKLLVTLCVAIFSVQGASISNDALEIMPFNLTSDALALVKELLDATQENVVRGAATVRQLMNSLDQAAVDIVADIKSQLNKTATGFVQTIEGLEEKAAQAVTNGLVEECASALQKLAQDKRVTLMWVPGHTGVPGNERADELARLGAETPYIGPEPRLGLSKRQVQMALKNWASEALRQEWERTTKCRQAKEFVDGPSEAKANWLNFLKQDYCKSLTQDQEVSCKNKYQDHDGLGVNVTTCIGDSISDIDTMRRTLVSNSSGCLGHKLYLSQQNIDNITADIHSTMTDVFILGNKVEACQNETSTNEIKTCLTGVTANITAAMTEFPLKITADVEKARTYVATATPDLGECRTWQVNEFTEEGGAIVANVTACVMEKLGNNTSTRTSTYLNIL